MKVLRQHLHLKKKLCRCRKEIKMNERKSVMAYLFVHFREKSTEDGEQIYFSLSREGYNWEMVNNGKPLLLGRGILFLTTSMFLETVLLSQPYMRASFEQLIFAFGIFFWHKFHLLVNVFSVIHFHHSRIDYTLSRNVSPKLYILSRRFCTFSF